MSGAWIYIDPQPQPRHHPRAYDPTAHLQRIGAPSAQAPPAEAVTPAPQMPAFGSAHRPPPVVRQPPPTFGEAVRGIALGMFLALVVLGAFAAVRFHSL
jgi:hypothetical protein